MTSSAGVPKYTLGGTDTVRVSAPVAKGQGMEYDPAKPGYCRPWSANSTTRAGVAATDAVPPSANGPENFGPKRDTVAAQKAPLTVRMKFTNAANKGDALVPAAAGAVAKGTPTGVLDFVGTCQGGDGGPTVEAGAVGYVELA